MLLIFSSFGAAVMAKKKKNRSNSINLNLAFMCSHHWQSWHATQHSRPLRHRRRLKVRGCMADLTTNSSISSSSAVANPCRQPSLVVCEIVSGSFFSHLHTVCDGSILRFFLY